MSVEQGIRDAVRALNQPSAFSMGGVRVLTIAYSKDEWRVVNAVVNGVVREIGNSAVHLACSEYTDRGDLVGRPVLSDGELKWIDGTFLRAYRNDSTIVLHDIHTLDHPARTIVSQALRGGGFRLEDDSATISNTKCVVLMTTDRTDIRSTVFHPNAIVVKG